MGAESVSRQLTREFSLLWRKVHPDGGVIYRDLTKFYIPIVDAEWVAANYTPPEMRTPHQHAVLALSTDLTQELLDADEYVFGIPLHNWGSASALKLWADQIVCFGRTMRITPTGLKGMLGGKSLTIFATAGRRYGHRFEDPSKNHLSPWLRTFFQNLVDDVRLVFVDGTAAITRGEVDRTTFLAPHIQSLRLLFGETAQPKSD